MKLVSIAHKYNLWHAHLKYTGNFINYDDFTNKNMINFINKVLLDMIWKSGKVGNQQRDTSEIRMFIVLKTMNPVHGGLKFRGVIIEAKVLGLSFI